MSEIKRKKAEYLLDSIGEIDERMIAEAMDIKTFQKSKGSFFIRSLAFAAAAVIVTGLSVSLILSQTLKKGDDVENVGENDIVIYQDVSDALAAAQSGNKAECFESPESIELFDGETKIVWQSAEGGKYYTLLLDRGKKAALSSALGETYADSKPADSESNSKTLVWISYGDGRIVSPYLKDSAGNVGYGELFEYSPEIMPSENFLKLVNSLTTE